MKTILVKMITRLWYLAELYLLVNSKSSSETASGFPSSNSVDQADENNQWNSSDLFCKVVWKLLLAFVIIDQRKAQNP